MKTPVFGGKRQEFQTAFRRVGAFIVAVFGCFFVVGQSAASNERGRLSVPTLRFEEAYPRSSGDGVSRAPLCDAAAALPEEENAQQSEEDQRFRTRLEALLGEDPMSAMIPALMTRDHETAIFLVSIARKESSWGRFVPTKDGADCFNYWGYKGTGSRGAGMGYACFASPEEAVETVGNRLAKLIHEQKLNSPERLIVWKCGSTCEGHSPESVAKWISDVRSVYSKFL